MTIAQALELARIERLDAELLISHLVSKDRSWIIAHSEEEIDQENIMALFERREEGEPLSYITGTKEFYGREFMVTPDVLIPRPATEKLIDVALDVFDKNVMKEIEEADTNIIIQKKLCHPEVARGMTVVDIGTGSGCIAVTLALELPEVKIIATDISEEALEIARKNAQRHVIEDRIQFRLGDGLDPIRNLNMPFLIVSNPPYIKKGTKLMNDVEDFEPHVALFIQNTSLVHSLISAPENMEYCIGSIVEYQRSK